MPLINPLIKPPRRALPFTCLQALRLLVHTVLLALPALVLAQTQPTPQPSAQFTPHVTSVRELMRFHVYADGSYRQVVEQQIRIDTEQGVRSRGELRLDYNAALENLEVVEAYTLQPDGTRIPVPADRIRTVEAEEDAVYSDEKTRVVIYPQVAVGSQLVLRSNSFVHTPLFPGHFYWMEHFNPHQRYENFILELSHEPGIDLRIAADRVAGGLIAPEPGDAPGVKRYRFTFAQNQAYPPERMQTSLVDYAPNLLISSFTSQADVARAYQVRAKPMARVTPAIEALAKSLVAGAADDAARVRRLYNWVSRNIRYVAVYAGAGGFVPHDSQSILDNRYGDCKDHVVLLEALLSAVGIDSSPALINASRAYTLASIPIPDRFDHAITYVPSLNLFLDSTATFTPMGSLPTGDQDKPVLLTATGTLARTPASTPERDRTDTSVWMQVQRDGRVSGHSRVRMSGAPAIDSRHSQFDYQSQNPVTTVNNLLARFGESGSGVIDPPDPHDLDSSWYVDAEFELDPLVNLPGPAAMTLPIGLTPGHIRAMMATKPPKTRRFPAVCPSMEHTEQMELKFPEGTKVSRIPTDVSFSQGGFSYRSSYRLTKQTLVAKRSYTVRRTTTLCDQKADQDWMALSKWLQRDLRAQVFFEVR